jgi:ATP-dependent Clp protease protease subunit
MGFVISTSGAKGKRYALKHARLMQHQPMTGVAPGTQASDIEITLNEINKLKKELYEIISENTGQTYEKIHADCDRDYWMTSEEAKAYGMVDEILLRNPK